MLEVFRDLESIDWEAAIGGPGSATAAQRQLQVLQQQQARQQQDVEQASTVTDLSDDFDRVGSGSSSGQNNGSRIRGLYLIIIT